MSEAIFHLKFPPDTDPEKLYSFLKELANSPSAMNAKVLGLEELEKQLRAQQSIPKDRAQEIFDKLFETRRQISDYFGLNSIEWKISQEKDCWGMTPDFKYVYWGGDEDDPPNADDGPYRQPVGTLVRETLDFTLVEVCSSCGSDPEAVIFDNSKRVR